MMIKVGGKILKADGKKGEEASSFDGTFSARVCRSNDIDYNIESEPFNVRLCLILSSTHILSSIYGNFKAFLELQPSNQTLSNNTVT